MGAYDDMMKAVSETDEERKRREKMEAEMHAKNPKKLHDVVRGERASGALKAKPLREMQELKGGVRG